jgi:hypothetical protein
MAQADYTFSTYDAIGNREDLSDIIYDISPMDTPFMSNGGRGTAEATYHEWQQDSLASAAANAQVEGDDISAYDTSTPTTRVGAYCQISRKTVLVSGTQRAVNSAGRKDELAYQLAKRSKELKRDLEFNTTNNAATVAGDDSTARAAGSIQAWLKTNYEDGANGAPPSYTTAPTDTRSDGDQRTFTEAQLKTVIQACWTAGGEPSILMVGAYNKTVASGFAGIAAQRHNAEGAKPTTIIGAADIYVSDFGNVSIVPNRFMKQRDALVLDPNGYSYDFLRPFMTEPMAKTGDAEKRLLLVEWTLKVNNEAQHGIVADLFTSAQ